MSSSFSAKIVLSKENDEEHMSQDPQSNLWHKVQKNLNI